jgi:hypothetical protein
MPNSRIDKKKTGLCNYKYFHYFNSNYGLKYRKGLRLPYSNSNVFFPFNEILYILRHWSFKKLINC